MQYFYSNDGAAQQGPVGREQLIAAGVTRDSMVWREGMAQWTRAGDVPELADLFGPQSVAPMTPTGPYPADTIYQPQYAASLMPPTSGFAIASLVLGILGLCCCNTFILALLAVIFGHLAKSEIRKGQKSGSGMATAGLVMGYIGLILGALIIGGAILNGVYHSRTTTFTPVTSSRNLSHP